MRYPQHTHTHIHTQVHTWAHTHMCTRSCSHVLHSVLHRNISPNSLHPSSADAALAMTYPKASAGIMKGDSNGVHLAYTITVFTPPPFGYKNVAVLQFIHCKTPLLPPTPPTPHIISSPLSELACNLDDPAKWVIWDGNVNLSEQMGVTAAL